MTMLVCPLYFFYLSVLSGCVYNDLRSSSSPCDKDQLYSEEDNDPDFCEMLSSNPSVFWKINVMWDKYIALG